MSGNFVLYLFVNFFRKFGSFFYSGFVQAILYFTDLLVQYKYFVFLFKARKHVTLLAPVAFDKALPASGSCSENIVYIYYRPVSEPVKSSLEEKNLRSSS